jgi:EpsI family protein
MIKRVLIVAGILVGSALYLSSAVKSEVVPIRRNLSEFPLSIGAYEGSQSAQFDQNTLDVLGVDDYLNRIYTNRDRGLITLYIGYYRSQKQGHTIHSPLNCLPGAGWNPIRRDVVSIPARGDKLHACAINRIIIQKGQDKQLVLYWYQSHGRVIASEYLGKIYSVVDAIRLNRTDAALVRIIGPIHEGTAYGNSEENAIKFAEELFAILNQYLPD